MQQEDKGLVYRGLILLSLIGVLALIVLGILFWRPQTTDPIERAAAPQEREPSAPGWEIRYNAAATLARRGSDAVPWPLIAEMLDEHQQMRNNRIRQTDGRDIHDEAVARATTLNALRAIAVYNEKRGDKKSNMPETLRAQIEKLAQSPAFELKVQAEKTRASFK